MRTIQQFILVPLTVLVARSAAGQQTLNQDSVVSPCDGRAISRVDYHPTPPTLIAKTAPPLLRPVVKVLLQQTTSKPSALWPFVLLRQGDQCTEFKRMESERLLRAEPYLADARIFALDDGAGGVRLDVETIDQLPLVIGGGFAHGTVSALSYGNANVAGSGMFGALDWEDGFAYRTGYGVRYTDYHIFGEPYTLAAEYEHQPLSSTAALSLGAPFLTEAQHGAWYAGVEDEHEFVSFLQPHDLSVSLGLDLTRADIGSVVRIGGRSTGLFAGPLMTYESIRPGNQPSIITSTGFVSDTSSATKGRYPDQQALRVGGVFGTRLLSYMEVHGFDALTGPQDVARGLAFASLAETGIGPWDHSTLFGADLYAGAGTSHSFVGLHAITEARAPEPGESSWTDGVASGRLAWYLQPNTSGILVTSFEFSGAWRERIPYELGLGEFPAGLRGYAGSHDAGGQRGVLRIERRWVLGHLTKVDNFGVAGFTDVGATWAGGIPYAVSSGYRQSVGASLLAAVPRDSRQLLRLDFAVPVIHDPHARYELRLTASAPIRMFWRDPPDIAFAREGTPISDIFNWP